MIEINEFLYRKHPGQEGAWHVVLATEIDDGFGGRTVTFTPPLTPEQAKEKGFPLDQVLKRLNTQALNEVEGLRAEREILKKDRDEARIIAGRLSLDLIEAQNQLRLVREPKPNRDFIVSEAQRVARQKSKV